MVRDVSGKWRYGSLPRACSCGAGVFDSVVSIAVPQRLVQEWE